MNPHAEYKEKMREHVAAFFEPEVTSLADDIHIFHFERGGDWRNAQILFVNRNGHHFRLIKQTDGYWLFVKTWASIRVSNDSFTYESWAADAQFKRVDPLELIKMCGTGPQGRDKSEALCLLPKDCTQRRKVVWRGTILGIRFDVDNDRFTISVPPGVAKSATFSGKLWLSQDAATWCRENVGAALVSTAQQPAVQQADEKVLMELEGSEMWGMF